MEKNSETCQQLLLKTSHAGLTSQTILKYIACKLLLVFIRYFCNYDPSFR